MKIKEGFTLCPTLGYTLVVATGELTNEFKSIIKLNETGADFWRWIEEGLSREQIIERFSEVYDVSEEVAAQDFDSMVAYMDEAGVFEK